MKVYELLDSENKWTQGAMARDECDNSVGIDNEKAVKWCLRGAMDKIYRKGYYEIKDRVMENISIKYDSIVHFNDVSNYQKVINLCKELDI